MLKVLKSECACCKKTIYGTPLMLPFNVSLNEYLSSQSEEDEIITVPICTLCLNALDTRQPLTKQIERVA